MAERSARCHPTIASSEVGCPANHDVESPARSPDLKLLIRAVCCEKSRSYLGVKKCFTDFEDCYIVNVTTRTGCTWLPVVVAFCTDKAFCEDIVPQLENIEAIEKRLWNAADTLRSSSNYASNEYFIPVMGLIFLRYAYSRFLAVKDEITANLPARGGKTRPLTKEDFSQKSAIFLQDKAQFDYLVSLTDRDDRAHAIIEAMESIEADYETPRGVLPKSEYQELDNEVLGRLLRILNPDELKKASGDIFGRIYEYFLTQFARASSISFPRRMEQECTSCTT